MLAPVHSLLAISIPRQTSCSQDTNRAKSLVGFRKLYRTYKELSTDNRAVQIFLVGIAWSEAADTALATIATTFMSEFLKMNSLEIGMALLVVLIAGIPGTMLGDFICKVPKYASFNTFW
jgi:MFS-type transporter involved in bile tolerance (Atg22 family)